MSKLRANIISVGFLQIFLFAVNFAALPFLTRSLEVVNFGVYALVIAVCQYLIILTNWGFWGQTVRAISIERSNYLQVCRIFSAAWIAQWLIFLLIFVISVAFKYILTFWGFHVSWQIFFAGVLIVVGNVLSVNWLLQGLEYFKVLASTQILGRLIALPLYFLFVNSSSDVAIALLITGGSGVAVGFFNLFYILNKKIIRCVKVGFDVVYSELVCGVSLVASQLLIAFYVTLIPIFLGVIAGPSQVALFNLADKFKTAGVSLMAPISQAIFPRMASLLQTNKKSASNLFYLSSTALMLVAFVGGIFLYVASDLIARIFGGDGFEAAGELIRMMAPIPFIITISSVVSTQIILPTGANRIYLSIYAIAGVLSSIFLWPLMSAFGARGAVWAMALIEIIVSILMAAYFFKVRAKIF